jgi:hypothetical protein
MIQHGITRDRPSWPLFVGFPASVRNAVQVLRRVSRLLSRVVVRARSGPVSIGINRCSRGSQYFQVRGEILRPWEDYHQRKQSAILHSLIKNESKGIEDDQIPS